MRRYMSRQSWGLSPNGSSAADRLAAGLERARVTRDVAATGLVYSSSPGSQFRDHSVTPVPPTASSLP